MSGVLREKKWLLIGVFLVTMFWTVVGIWFGRSMLDGEKSEAQIGEIQNLSEVSEKEGGTVVTFGEGSAFEAATNTKLLEVDLASLREKNSDTVGWVQIVGTSINYPYVQGRDNEYYTIHSFDKSYNTAGWPFLDASNQTDLSDRHNIIYLHGNIEGTQFENIRGIIASNWLMTEADNVIRTSDGKTSLVWQVFSIYKAEKTKDYLKTSFKDTDDFLKFAEKLKAKSVYNFGVSFSEDDRMLTFSIKYDDEHVIAIHARLVKRS